MDSLELALIFACGFFCLGVVLTVVSMILKRKSEDDALILPGSGFMVLKSKTRSSQFRRWVTELSGSLSSELFGAAITTLVLSVFLGLAQRGESEADQKRLLIIQLGNSSPAIAEEALDQLRLLGWLYDGSLEGADLRGAALAGLRMSNANLQRVNFREANLSLAYLMDANLTGATFLYANLTSADLRYADLSFTEIARTNLVGAYLTYANLHGAFLSQSDLTSVSLDAADLSEVSFGNSNLRNASLGGANLQGASMFATNLRGANLRGANLVGVSLPALNNYYTGFDQSTLLPDGTFWTPDTDLTRFTNPEHPDFWQSPEYSYIQ